MGHVNIIVDDTTVEDNTVDTWEDDTMDISREDLQRAGLPIRTVVDLQTLKPAPSTRDHQRRNLLDSALKVWNDWTANPHSRTGGWQRATKVLPLVTGYVTVESLDVDALVDVGKVEMIWDTAAEFIMISEDTLPKGYDEWFPDSARSFYGSDKGQMLVQVNINVALSNQSIPINTLATVVPRYMMPYGHSGIVFGQAWGIDRLAYRSVPRSILELKDREVEADGRPRRLLTDLETQELNAGIWGDLVVEAYVDANGQLATVD